MRFLKPGFHSGTIPKLFQKMRRATWKGDERGIAKQEEALHHVAEALEKFIDREARCRCSRAASRSVSTISRWPTSRLAANRVRFELACPSLAPERAW